MVLITRTYPKLGLGNPFCCDGDLSVLVPKAIPRRIGLRLVSPPPRGQLPDEASNTGEIDDRTPGTRAAFLVATTLEDPPPRLQHGRAMAGALAPPREPLVHVLPPRYCIERPPRRGGHCIGDVLHEVQRLLSLRPRDLADGPHDGGCAYQGACVSDGVAVNTPSGHARSRRTRREHSPAAHALRRSPHRPPK